MLRTFLDRPRCLSPATGTGGWRGGEGRPAHATWPLTGGVNYPLDEPSWQHHAEAASLASPSATRLSREERRRDGHPLRQRRLNAIAAALEGRRTPGSSGTDSARRDQNRAKHGWPLALRQTRTAVYADDDLIGRLRRSYPAVFSDARLESARQVVLLVIVRAPRCCLRLVDAAVLRYTADYLVGRVLPTCCAWPITWWPPAAGSSSHCATTRQTRSFRISSWSRSPRRPRWRSGGHRGAPLRTEAAEEAARLRRAEHGAVVAGVDRRRPAAGRRAAISVVAAESSSAPRPPARVGGGARARRPRC